MFHHFPNFVALHCFCFRAFGALLFMGVECMGDASKHSLLIRFPSGVEGVLSAEDKRRDKQRSRCRQSNVCWTAGETTKESSTLPSESCPVAAQSIARSQLIMAFMLCCGERGITPQGGDSGEPSSHTSLAPFLQRQASEAVVETISSGHATLVTRHSTVVPNCSASHRIMDPNFLASSRAR